MAIFGPDRKDIWEQLSKEIHAHMVEGDGWNGDRIEVCHNNWTLYLETDTVPTGDTNMTYTRMLAPFVSKDHLVFRIYKSSIFSNIGKLLGMEDIKTGHDGFDDDYIIKGNHKDKIIQLFDHELIRDLILRQPNLSLEIKSTEGTSDTDDQYELYFSYAGAITDTGQIKDLFDLFMEVLDGLVRVDSAYSRAPDVDIFEEDH